MRAQATKVWLSFDNLQVSEERYLWQNPRSLSHGPRGSSDRQWGAMPKPRHLWKSQWMFPSEVKHCIQTNGADHRVQTFGWKRVTWLSLTWKNLRGESMNQCASTGISPFRHFIFLSETVCTWFRASGIVWIIHNKTCKKDKIIKSSNMWINYPSDNKMHTWTIANFTYFICHLGLLLFLTGSFTKNFEAYPS